MLCHVVPCTIYYYYYYYYYYYHRSLAASIVTSDQRFLPTEVQLKAFAKDQ